MHSALHSQARRVNGTSAAVKAVNQADYGSDDEVYALASAVDAADPQYEEERSLDKKAVDPLPPVDHSNIEYDEFNKDFYQEAKEITALTPAEVQQTSLLMSIAVALALTLQHLASMHRIRGLCLQLLDQNIMTQPVV